jgi:hypothetical protein
MPRSQLLALTLPLWLAACSYSAPLDDATHSPRPDTQDLTDPDADAVEPDLNAPDLTDLGPDDAEPDADAQEPDLPPDDLTPADAPDLSPDPDDAGPDLSPDAEAPDLHDLADLDTPDLTEPDLIEPDLEPDLIEPDPCLSDDPPLPCALLVLYNFNDLQDIQDESGNDHHGQLFGNASLRSLDDSADLALILGGDGDHVQLPQATALLAGEQGVPQPFSLVLWASAAESERETPPRGLASHRVQRGGENFSGWSLTQIGDKLHLELSLDAARSVTLKAEPQLMADRPTLIALVYDAQRRLTVSMDGRPVIQVIAPWLRLPDAPLALGARALTPEGAPLQTWEGALSMAQLWRRALTQDELASLALRRGQGLPTSCPEGQHDGGDGACLPHGQCAPGLIIIGQNQCAPDHLDALRLHFPMDALRNNEISDRIHRVRLQTSPQTVLLEGRFGDALPLDTQPATATLPDALGGAVAKSVNFFFQLPPANTTAPIPLLTLTRGNQTLLSMTLTLINGGTNQWTLRVTQGGMTRDVALPLSPARWHMLTWQSKANEGPDLNKYRLYLDGAMMHALELSAGAPLTLAAGDVLTLDGPDQQALLVDELRVYDQILTHEQRQQLRNHNQLDDVCWDGHAFGGYTCTPKGRCDSGFVPGQDGACHPIINGQLRCNPGTSPDATRRVCLSAVATITRHPSCESWRAAGFTRAGTYWLDDGAAPPYEVDCDFDMMGWALAARVDGRQTALGFDDPAWTHAEDRTPHTLAQAGDRSALFTPYWALQGAELLLVVESPPGSARFKTKKIMLGDMTLLERLANGGDNQPLSKIEWDKLFNLDVPMGALMACEGGAFNLSSPSRARIGAAYISTCGALDLYGGVGLDATAEPWSEAAALTAGLVWGPEGALVAQEATVWIYIK